jgi:hypothetical protein
MTSSPYTLTDFLSLTVGGASYTGPRSEVIPDGPLKGAVTAVVAAYGVVGDRKKAVAEAKAALATVTDKRKAAIKADVEARVAEASGETVTRAKVIPSLSQHEEKLATAEELLKEAEAFFAETATRAVELLYSKEGDDLRKHFTNEVQSYINAESAARDEWLARRRELNALALLAKVSDPLEKPKKLYATNYYTGQRTGVPVTLAHLRVQTVKLDALEQYDEEMVERVLAGYPAPEETRFFNSAIEYRAHRQREKNEKVLQDWVDSGKTAKDLL